MERVIIEPIRKDFGDMPEIMEKVGYKIIFQDYDYEMFGNITIRFSGDDMDLYIVKDRGIYEFTVEPKTGFEEFHLETFLTFIDHYYIAIDTKSAQKVLTLFLKHQQELGTVINTSIEQEYFKLFLNHLGKISSLYHHGSNSSMFDFKYHEPNFNKLVDFFDSKTFSHSSMPNWKNKFQYPTIQFTINRLSVFVWLVGNSYNVQIAGGAGNIPSIPFELACNYISGIQTINNQYDFSYQFDLIESHIEQIEELYNSPEKQDHYRAFLDDKVRTANRLWKE